MPSLKKARMPAWCPTRRAQARLEEKCRERCGYTIRPRARGSRAMPLWVARLSRHPPVFHEPRAMEPPEREPESGGLGHGRRVRVLGLRAGEREGAREGAGDVSGAREKGPTWARGYRSSACAVCVLGSGLELSAGRRASSVEACCRFGYGCDDWFLRRYTMCGGLEGPCSTCPRCLRLRDQRCCCWVLPSSLASENPISPSPPHIPRFHCQAVGAVRQCCLCPAAALRAQERGQRNSSNGTDADASEGRAYPGLYGSCPSVIPSYQGGRISMLAPSEFEPPSWTESEHPSW
ncbi:hypothetical protein C2E23DRAFT_458055 [Lenzites betulinus]|nr:hypothetical protein C2E23DRAFT_458055 [Lenzites betulinus]